MKTMLRILPIVVVIVAFAGTPALAGKKKKNGPGAAPAAQPAGPQPGVALEPYITNLDFLLALNPPGKGPHALRNEAPGRLAILKQQFTTARATAQGADAAKYNSAIATCNALTAAIDERQQTAGHIQSSASVGGSEQINAPRRKDVLNQGVRGRDFAKAVGEIEEGKREKAEKQAGREATAKSDASMTAMALSRWNQRVIELRKQITAAYARIGS